MVPSFHGSNDFVWICDPGKGFGVFVGFGDEAIDGGLEIDERVEDAAFEPPSCEFGEEALDGVEPGGGWREVEDKSLVAIEPSPDLWMLMDGVVVEDDVDGLVGRNLSVDHVQEANVNSWCRWRCILRPITVPSSTFKAAKSVVVPLRL